MIDIDENEKVWSMLMTDSEGCSYVSLFINRSMAVSQASDEMGIEFSEIAYDQDFDIDLMEIGDTFYIPDIEEPCKISRLTKNSWRCTPTDTARPTWVMRVDEQEVNNF